jgi:hypothetical protein
MSLADYQTLVTDLVRDRDNVVSPDQRDAAITAAVAQYSSDRPRPIVVDAEAQAPGNVLDLPDGWTPDSVLLAAEFPIGQLQPSMLDMSEVQIYDTPTSRELRVPVQLEIGDAVRLTYTADQLLDADNDTIPLRHRQAVASLAAAMLCGQLASYYAGESESTISADTVDRKTKSDQWRARQKDLLAAYANTVGIAPSDRVKGASAVKELRRNDSLGGRRLFHPPQNWPVT